MQPPGTAAQLRTAILLLLLVTVAAYLQVLRADLVNQVESVAWVAARSVASSIITHVAQQSGGSTSTASELPPLARTMNAATAYVNYMAKMPWPAKLAVFYPHPGNTPMWQPLGAFVVPAAVTALAMRRVRNPLSCSRDGYGPPAAAENRKSPPGCIP
jgi:hypothetical protein